MRQLPWIIAFVVFAGAANVAAVAYVRGERTLYYWDQVNYWSKAADLAGMIRAGDAGGAVARAVLSPRHDEYNSLPALPLAFVLAALGDSRLAFILGVVNLYVLPAAAAAMWLARRCSARPNAAGALALTMIALNPLFWSPVFLGYVDAGGMAILCAILAVSLRPPADDERRSAWWRRAILLGFLLAAVVLFRRWYAYWVACFGVVLLVDWLIAGKKRPRSAASIVALCIAAATASAVIFLVCGLSGIARFFVNHHDQYAAYRPPGGLGASLLESFRASVFHQGWPLAALGVAGCLWAICNRSTRRSAIVLAATSLLVILPFSRIHPLGAAPHHFYLILLPLLLWPAVMIGELIARRPVWGGILLAAATAYGTANLAAALTHRPPALPSSMLAEARFPPVVRSDLDQLIAMMRSIPAAQAGDNDIYVAASSKLLSASHLSLLNLSLNWRPSEKIPACRQVIHPGELDARDGFPEQLLRARYVIAATPSQYHVRPDHQTVVDVVARCFLDRRSVGRAFSQRGEPYHLSNGVTAILFERTRPIAEDDVQELRRLLHQAHPEVYPSP